MGRFGFAEQVRMGGLEWDEGPWGGCVEWAQARRIRVHELVRGADIYAAPRIAYAFQ